MMREATGEYYATNVDLSQLARARTLSCETQPKGGSRLTVKAISSVLRSRCKTPVGKMHFGFALRMHTILFPGLRSQCQHHHA